MDTNSDSDLIWSICINTFGLKEFENAIEPEQIAKLKQYFLNEDKENFNKLLIEILQEKERKVDEQNKHILILSLHFIEHPFQFFHLSFHA